MQYSDLRCPTWLSVCSDWQVSNADLIIWNKQKFHQLYIKRIEKTSFMTLINPLYTEHMLHLGNMLHLCVEKCCTSGDLSLIPNDRDPSKLLLQSKLKELPPDLISITS